MASDPSTRAPRVLVIGAGPMCISVHLPIMASLRDRGEIVLETICDIQRDRAAAARRKFKFRNESGDAVAALEQDDIDAVYIFGGAQMHYEYGLHALKWGKHLFVEKPIAPSFAQAVALAQAAKVRGLVAAAGHNRRFHKSLAAVRTHSGKSRWRTAEAVFHKPEFGRPVPFGARSWLGANGIHALDALIYLMGGLPDSMTALAGDSTKDGANVFSALMRWPDGAQGVFLCNNHAGARREEYVFHAPGETLTADARGLTIEKGSRVSTIAHPAIDGFVEEHEAFLDAIRNGSAPTHSIEAIAPSLFLAELIESGFSGPVRLPQPEITKAAHSPRIYGQSILVVHPAPLQNALAELMPRYRLVSVEDVRRAAGGRPDVVAALFGQGGSPLPVEILDRLPGLRVAGIMGLSLARYEPEALLARGVTLLNASAAYAESVAEFTLGLAILGRRRAFVSHDVMAAGGWGTSRLAQSHKGRVRRALRHLRPAAKTLGLEPLAQKVWRTVPWLSDQQNARTMVARDLRGARIGLIGWGFNARAFNDKLIQAGASVMVYSEHAQAHDIHDAGAVPASLAEVLAADIVSLHRALNKDTYHALGAAEMAQLRPGAVLINVARGALIEPNALLGRLQVGDVFACLDTFEDEPPAASDPLRHLPNVFLTSHIAGGSPDMHAAAAREIVDKISAYLEGENIAPVSAARLRVMS